MRFLKKLSRKMTLPIAAIMCLSCFAGPVYAANAYNGTPVESGEETQSVSLPVDTEAELVKLKNYAKELADAELTAVYDPAARKVTANPALSAVRNVYVVEIGVTEFGSTLPIDIALPLKECRLVVNLTGLEDGEQYKFMAPLTFNGETVDTEEEDFDSRAASGKVLLNFGEYSAGETGFLDFFKTDFITVLGPNMDVEYPCCNVEVLVMAGGEEGKTFSALASKGEIHTASPQPGDILQECYFTPLPIVDPDPEPTAEPSSEPSETPDASESPSPEPSETQEPDASVGTTDDPSDDPAPSASQSPAPSTSQSPAPSASQSPAPSASQSPAPSTSQSPAPQPSQPGWHNDNPSAAKPGHTAQPSADPSSSPQPSESAGVEPGDEPSLSPSAPLPTQTGNPGTSGDQNTDPTAEPTEDQNHVAYIPDKSVSVDALPTRNPSERPEETPSSSEQPSSVPTDDPVSATDSSTLNAIRTFLVFGIAAMAVCIVGIIGITVMQKKHDQDNEEQ